MPSHFETLRFQRSDTPQYRAIRDNALRSANLFVERAAVDEMETAFQKKLSLVAPDGTLDEQAVSCWERIYISRLSELCYKVDDAAPITVSMRIANEMSSDRTRYKALQTALSTRKSATPDSIELTTISHGSRHGSADSPVEGEEDGVRENAHAMAELFIMVFKKTHRKFEDFDKHATAVKLDDFMSWVKQRKEVEWSKIMTWYGDRYHELYAQREKLVEKNPEGKEKLMGAWTQCYEDALQRLNVGDEKNEGLRHYFKHQIKMKQRVADFCKDYAEDHKLRADEDVGCDLTEGGAAAERTHNKLPSSRIPPLNLANIYPVEIAGEFVFLLPIIKHAQDVAALVQEIYCKVFATTPSTTAHFDVTAKDLLSLDGALKQVITEGMFSQYIFVSAQYFIFAGVQHLPEAQKSLCHPEGEKPEVCDYLEAQWQKNYTQALAPIRAALIESGKLVDVPPSLAPGM